jgi:hypothetical protein
MTGHCHCGALVVEVAACPTFLYDCNCSLCRNSGALWGYYPTADVSIRGVVGGYRRADHNTSKGQLHFCQQCGSTSHFAPDSEAEGTMLAINMKLFDPAALADIPIHFPDGANWTGAGKWAFRADASPHKGMAQ